MPRKPLLDARFTGMHSEKIYTLLQDDPESESLQDVDFSHGIWERDPEGEWTVRVRSAVNMAKARGSITADLEDRIERMLNPALPWHQLLRRWLTERARADYTYSPPNRRHLQHGLVLPTLASQTLGKVAIGFDTSGSMDAKEMGRGLAEILSLREYYSFDLMLIQSDCEVKSITEIPAHEVIDGLAVKGGGGTDFRPVVDTVEQADEGYCGLIYFTDGVGTYPEHAPRLPVLWVLTGGHEIPPWGECCRLESDEAD
jgi:predicted metal-dependent peptidase